MKTAILKGTAAAFFAVAMGMSGSASAYPNISCSEANDSALYQDSPGSDGWGRLWQCLDFGNGYHWYVQGRCNRYGCEYY